MKKLFRVWGIGLAAVVTLLAGQAQAAIIVTTGVDNTGTDNVIVNGCNSGLVTANALTVQGCFNTDHAAIVNFTSDELLSISGGQAALTANDGAFSYLKIWLGGGTFSKLLLNIDSNADGSVIFTGNPGGSSAAFALDKNGQNKFIITGENFSYVEFATTVGINSLDLVADVKQVRIGTAPYCPPGATTCSPSQQDVPEPASVALLGLGFLAAGFARKRK